MKPIILIAIILLCIYLIYETTTLKITKHKIQNKKIPTEFNNYKIIQISDFHDTKSSKLNKDIIDNLKKEQPNLIFITGDLVGSPNTNIEELLTFIKKIINLAPIYYVTGNHEAKLEAKLDNYKNLKQKLLALKVNILDNQTTTIQINNQSIKILGINDPDFTNKNNNLPNDQIVSKQLDKLSSNNNNHYQILLSHRPELFATYVNKNIDLIFTGHAHGGQIRIPYLGALYAPNQGLFPKYTSGIFKKHNSTMIVSKGIGTSKIPFRINCRPEIIIVILKNK